MDFIVNRRGRLSLREQLVIQIKLKILCGELAEGRKLPSIRSLARRLKIHPNTVAAAYRELGLSGNVAANPGVGVFAIGAPAAPQDDRTFEELLETTLQSAIRRGFSSARIRAAVEHWLINSPTDRIVVVDRFRETAELLREEIRLHVDVPVLACTLDDVKQQPSRLTSALTVTLPFCVDSLRLLVENVFLITLRMRFPEKWIFEIPPGARALFVSHAPRLLPFSSGLFFILRGDEATFECRPLSARAEWERIAHTADLVYADVCSAPAVADVRPKRMVEIRLLTPATLAEICSAATFVRPVLAQGVPTLSR